MLIITWPVDQFRIVNLTTMSSRVLNTFFASLLSILPFFTSQLCILFKRDGSILFLLIILVWTSFWSLIAFNCSSFLSEIFFSLFKSTSFVSSYFSPLLKKLTQRRILKSCSTVLGSESWSSPVKYSYLSISLKYSADILAVFLSNFTVFHFV